MLTNFFHASPDSFCPRTDHPPFRPSRRTRNRRQASCTTLSRHIFGSFLSGSAVSRVKTDPDITGSPSVRGRFHDTIRRLTRGSCFQYPTQAPSRRYPQSYVNLLYCHPLKWTDSRLLPSRAILHHPALSPRSLFKALSWLVLLLHRRPNRRLCRQKLQRSGTARLGRRHLPFGYPSRITSSVSIRHA